MFKWQYEPSSYSVEHLSSPFSMNKPEDDWQPSQISKMEIFAEVVSNRKQSIICTKCSILNVSLGFANAPAIRRNSLELEYCMVTWNDYSIQLRV